jgi:hypothetical protein
MKRGKILAERSQTVKNRVGGKHSSINESRILQLFSPKTQNSPSSSSLRPDWNAKNARKPFHVDGVIRYFYRFVRRILILAPSILEASLHFCVS